MSRRRKLVIVVPDGMADRRYPELGGRSPVEYAETPAMDEIVRRGRVGLVQTMYEDLPLGTLVGLLGILGYRPPDYFPLGRSIFEARALGVNFSPRDLLFRCNLVRVDDDGRLADFTAGQINDVAARRYLADLTPAEGLEIVHDLSYRGVLVCRDCPLDERELLLHEPHESVGDRIEELMPRYRGEPCRPLVDLMLPSLRDGLMLWPWGPSRAREFPPLRFRVATVSALSFVSGMAESLGGRGLMPSGATGYLHSDLGAKLAAAKACLSEVEVCLVHCNAPDEEAHVGHLQGKVAALEEIDRLVVGPLLRHLDALEEPYRLWLLPDHYTLCHTGRHQPGFVPYALLGTGITPDHDLRAFSETRIAEAQASKPVLESCSFLASLLEA